MPTTRKFEMKDASPEQAFANSKGLLRKVVSVPKDELKDRKAAARLTTRQQTKPAK